MLAVMLFSGLFQDRFIHQVQVVGYLHSVPSGGDFVYYNTESSTPQIMKPLPRSGAIIDGSKTIHAAIIYRPESTPPLLDKSTENVLTYGGDEKWSIVVGGKVTGGSISILVL